MSDWEIHIQSISKRPKINVLVAVWRKRGKKGGKGLIEVSFFLVLFHLPKNSPSSLSSRHTSRLNRIGMYDEAVE